MPENGAFIEALWDEVRRLSEETGDVFMVLLAALTALNNPESETAIIRPCDLAQYRGVKHRDGSVQKLHDALKEQVLLIAKLRLTLIWKDKNTLLRHLSGTQKLFISGSYLQFFRHFR